MYTYQDGWQKPLFFLIFHFQENSPFNIILSGLGFAILPAGVSHWQT
jgi:hypothetical protein